jgi:hypothetical protein
MTRSLSARLLTSAMLAATSCFALTRTTSAQNRGVYPLGMSATNSGVTPEPGFAYVNQLLIYTRDESKGPNGEVLGTGSNSVVMDMNTLAWVSRKMYFQEFANRSTFQGHSIQFSGSIKF